MKNSKIIGALAAVASLSQIPAFATTIVVNDFQTISGPVTVDAWYKSDVRNLGTATVQDLTGMGGNLENSQPLPTGAARLTTTLSALDKAEVATYNDFGLASTVLNSVDVAYSYYKSTGGASPAVAPAIKLEIQTVGGTGDNYGQLIYEPYQNTGNPPSGAWTSVTANQNTGSGNNATGGWWWSGGFEVANGFGGGLLMSLSEWVTKFQATDATDFANARVTALIMGIGSNNKGEDNYFDSVSIKTGSFDKTYDFQAASAPDAGATLGLFGLSLAGISVLRLRRKS